MFHFKVQFPMGSAILLLVSGLAGIPETSQAQTQAPPQAQAPVIITMRAMQNPLSLSQCTVIEVVVTDAYGRAPLRPDGRQVSGWDVELSLASPAADAFGWGDERHRTVCALAPTAPYAMVAAHYPAGFLKDSERLANVQADQSIQVIMQAPGAPPAQYSQQPPVAGTPTGQPQPGPQAGVPPGQPYMPPTGATPVAGTQPGYSQSGAPQLYPQPGNPQQPPAAPTQTSYAPPTSPPAGPATAVGTAPTAQPGVYTGPAPAPVAVAAQTAPPAAAQPAEKGGGGFFKKLGKHLKDKATEVTHQTAENLSTTANQMVDATAQTGSNLVSGAAAQATSVAESKVGGVTNSLVPAALRVGGEADNLGRAVASGEVVLRTMTFLGNTEVLTAAGRLVAANLAKELNKYPGTYEIQAHVDPLPPPAEAGAGLELSKRRAEAVRQALVGEGVVKDRLIAQGYGAYEPLPEAPPEGGPPSSARIVISRMKQ